MRHIFRHLQHRPIVYWLPFIVFVLVFTTVLAVTSYLPRQAAHAASTDWTTFLGSNARTGYDSAETIINPTTAPNLKLHWTASTVNHALITTEVMTANGMLYWGSWDGVLHASDPNTGNDLWTANLGTRPGGCSNKPKGVISSVTVATVPIKGIPTSVVFVGSGPASLFALDALKGTILWQTTLSSDTDYGSTPTLFQATINGVSHAMLGMANKNGYYYALDRTNISAGSLWKVRVSLGGAAPAKAGSIAASAYDGTSLYVAESGTTIGGLACAGSLRKVDPSSGAFLWEDCLPGAVLAPTLAVPGLVIVGAGKNMDVVNSQTGQILYTYTDTATNGGFWRAATISNGVLYEGSKSGHLFAFGL